MNELHETLLNLNLDKVRRWAGSTILNRGKSYRKNVHDLVRTEDGGLLATVSGTEEYATWVGVDEDGILDYFCTCPYDWGVCKHAVAVLLEGLAMVKAGEPIPPAAPDDPRGLAVDEEYADEDFDDFDEYEQSAEEMDDVESVLRKKKKDELLDLLLRLARELPEVRRDILETNRLESGDIRQLVSALSDEIDEVTGEDAWSNWHGEGNLPDYSHIQKQLSTLLARGYADEVVELGRQLWQQGSEQVANSHDDGETANEVAESMDIVFEAVSASSLSKTEQLLWYIDVFLEDEYSLSDGGSDYLEDESYGKEDWREVAEHLQARLAGLPKPKKDSFTTRYHRKQVMNWLIEALDRSGQPQQVLPLLEQEAHMVQCYDQLVDLLLEQGETTRARQWCLKGYERTKKEAPGIAAGLQKRLRELAGQENNPELVAAYRAQDFFDHPDLNNYLKLGEACEDIGCWPEVRAAVMVFLEKGRKPEDGGSRTAWPLPTPEVVSARARVFRPDFPLFGVLIDIALHEKRLDDAVALYKQQTGESRRQGSRDKEVAQAVENSHPDVALTIWGRLARQQIDQVKPAAYRVAAGYLDRMRRIYQQTDRAAEWQELLTAIRHEHKRKRRLMEVLDSLEGKRLID